jgi:hypothetical protein
LPSLISSPLVNGVKTYNPNVYKPPVFPNEKKPPATI